MKRYTLPLLFLLFVSLLGAQSVTTPDCTQAATFTGVANGPVMQAKTGSGAGCSTIALTWYVTGFSAAKVHLQGSQDNATFADITTTALILEGSNPTSWTTSTVSNRIVIRAYLPYFRVVVDTLTGSGSVFTLMLGYKGTNSTPIAASGGGGTIGGSIAANQVAVGTGANTIGGNNNFQDFVSAITAPFMIRTLIDAADGSSDAPARTISASHNSSATPIEVDTGITGFSSGYEWRMVDATGTVVPTMTLDCLWRDPTGGDQTCATVLRATQYGSGLIPMMLLDDWNTNYAIGFNADNPDVVTGVENTAFGESLSHVTTGIRNSGFSSSLQNVTTGSYNSAFGDGTCTVLSTGSQNTCLGALSTVSGATASNETMVGYNVTGAGSNTATIGNSSVTDVYLGGAGAAATVHVAGCVGCGGGITLKTNGTNNGSQSILNLAQGSNVTLTDNGSGTVTIAASGGGGSSSGFTVYSGLAGIALTGTTFFPFGGGNPASTTETVVQTKVAAAATFANFSANLSVALGTTLAVNNSVVLTFRDNTSSQTLTCTITNPAVSCSDVTHSFTTAVGDLIDVQAVFTGTISATPVFLMAVQVGAAPTGGGSVAATTFASLPGTCTSGNLYLFTNSVISQALCGAANTYTYFSSFFGQVTPPVLGSFTAVNSPTTSTTNGGIVMTAPAHSGDLARLLVQNLPGVPYTATACEITPNPNVQFLPIGLALYDGTKVAAIGAYDDGGNAIRSWKLTNLTTFSAYYNTVAQLGTGPMCFRIQDDGTNRIMSWSYDNVVYNVLTTVGNTDFLTPTQIGLDVDANNTTWPAVAWFFHFKVTTP